MNGAPELERLQKEAEELRALVRELSARQAVTISALPLETALALARGGEASPDPAFRLEKRDETSELTRVDVASEMELLWRRLSPREGA
ncbi:MAG TPA: hypothetical protein VF554_02725 [Thermoanaerobaculia bacterium]